MSEETEPLFFELQMETDLSKNTSKTVQYEDVDKNAQYEDPVAKSVFFYALVVLAEVLGISAVALVAVWASIYLGGFAWDGSGKMFNWHPLFMVIGLIFLYGNAAISYRVLRKLAKPTVKLIHASINFSAFVFVVLGIYTVFAFHIKNKIPNVYSIHSWVGILTIGLYAFQLVFGFLGFLFPKFNDTQRATYLKIHVYFGAIIFALAIVACISGITEKMLFGFMRTYKDFPPVGIVGNTIGGVIILFGLLVTFIIYNSDFKRVLEHDSVH